MRRKAHEHFKKTLGLLPNYAPAINSIAALVLDDLIEREDAGDYGDNTKLINYVNVAVKYGATDRPTKAARLGTLADV